MNKNTLVKTLILGVLTASALTVSALAASIGGGTVATNSLNFRSAPNTSASIYASVAQGTVVVVAEKTSSDWYKVVHRGAVGYMSAQYIDFGETLDGSFGTGTIRGSDVRMRSSADLGASIIGTYQHGTSMNVIGVSVAWYKVEYQGVTGYVHSDFFSLNGGKSDFHSPSNAASSDGQAIVDAAMKYQGVPYVWGGTSASGFDCSGLVYYVYKECGYSTNRTAASLYDNGVAVEKANLQVGDNVFFTTSSSSSIGHVGIYIGNGQFIHASSGSGSVVISDLSSSYYLNHYVGARRIV